MKFTMSKVAFLTIGAVFASPVVRAQDTGAGETYADRHCAWCHSQSGRGYSLAPKLAGQRPEYMRIQLQRFRAKPDLRSDFYMSHVPRTDSRTKRDISLYYSHLSPTPAADGNRELVAKGKEIYDFGVTPFVVACAFCHGPAAQGIGSIPRLGGQSYFYLKQKLTRWVQGHDKEASRMPALTVNLSKDQIEALSSYLSFVR